MTDLHEFLAARYREARARENGKRRSIPSVFDGHEVEVRYSSDEGEAVLVDGHPYPANEYWATATEPAPDPTVLADLDSKLAILEEHPTTRDVIAEKPDGLHGFGCATCHQNEGMTVGYGWCRTLRHLAVPFAAHPDYDEMWRP